MRGGGDIEEGVGLYSAEGVRMCVCLLLEAFGAWFAKSKRMGDNYFSYEHISLAAPQGKHFTRSR